MHDRKILVSLKLQVSQLRALYPQHLESVGREVFEIDSDKGQSWQTSCHPSR
jgi:hypothetical protein